MIRTAVAAAALGMIAIPTIALADNHEATEAAPAEAPAAKYSVETTLIGDMLDNPELKAILVKHLPEVAEGEQIEMARALTLRDIQPYAPDYITEEALAAIEEEFKQVG